MMIHTTTEFQVSITARFALNALTMEHTERKGKIVKPQDVLLQNIDYILVSIFKLYFLCRHYMLIRRTTTIRNIRLIRYRSSWIDKHFVSLLHLTRYRPVHPDAGCTQILFGPPLQPSKVRYSSLLTSCLSHDPRTLT